MCGCVAGDRMAVRSKKTNSVQYGKILSVQNKRFLGAGNGTQEFEILLDNGNLMDIEANYSNGIQLAGDDWQLTKVDVPVEA